eukprot:TRINITY_DN22229_c0_g1_i1.p3 TRINITY_DN22229_c0_g1~~TRINITY_DN22229_c0_g1_i1.p3  ORF type:complete len:101 (+),score=4.37 TRINITY_DN22229_c0_g1_i1:479-781(+)
MAPLSLMLSPGVMVGVAAGAVALKMHLDQEQAASSAFNPYSNPCPTCHGSREVPCLCRKWSDGDVGCGSCQGSGSMRCSTCGGSGTRRAMPVRIRSSSQR